MREWRESEWRNAWTNSSRGCERLKEGGGEERRAEEKNSERINVLCLGPSLWSGSFARESWATGCLSFQVLVISVLCRRYVFPTVTLYTELKVLNHIPRKG